MTDVNAYPEQARRGAVAMNYRRMAVALEEAAATMTANEPENCLQPWPTAGRAAYWAKVARRAADAEMKDREP